MSKSYLQRIIDFFTFNFSPKTLPGGIKDDFFIIACQDTTEYGQKFFICCDNSIIIIDKTKFQQFFELYSQASYYYIYDNKDDIKPKLTEATNSSINLEAIKALQIDFQIQKINF